MNGQVVAVREPWFFHLSSCFYHTLRGTAPVLQLWYLQSVQLEWPLILLRVLVELQKTVRFWGGIVMLLWESHP